MESRPLLVPVSSDVPESLYCKQSIIIDSCSQLGIDLEWTAPNKLLVRRVPIPVPYLDLRLFIESLTLLQSFEEEDFFDLLMQSQHMGASMLTEEESMALTQWLTAHKKEQHPASGLYKELSADACRMFLNE